MPRSLKTCQTGKSIYETAMRKRTVYITYTIRYLTVIIDRHEAHMCSSSAAEVQYSTKFCYKFHRFLKIIDLIAADSATKLVVLRL